MFPRALVQWEDFASRNAFAILDRYRDRVLSFNDDIEGTGAVVVAGIRSALRHVGRRLEEERIVFFGAGASGAGSALAVRRALRAASVAERDLGAHVVCLDSKGLLLRDRPGVEGEKLTVAADPALVREWNVARRDAIGLADVVRNFHPTVLVGASGQRGAFSEAIIREMHRGCPRPIILPISNPTDNAEAVPSAILSWTDGAAVVGTGSPFPPVSLHGVTHHIGQGNNALIFPGVGLGAIAVDARRLTESAFEAAGNAVFEYAGVSGRPGEPIYPPLAKLRDVSVRVALAVATALIEAGAAPSLTRDEIEARVRSIVWEPVYRPYRKA